MSSGDSELLAQQVSGLNENVKRLEQRMAEVERVNSRLEQAALTTARALQEISGNWDAVYEAMRRVEKIGSDDERDAAALGG
jgi:outer membrane murein-binding lipoprotein Lpp